MSSLPKYCLCSPCGKPIMPLCGRTQAPFGSHDAEPPGLVYLGSLRGRLLGGGTYFFCRYASGIILTGGRQVESPGSVPNRQIKHARLAFGLVFKAFSVF